MDPGPKLFFLDLDLRRIPRRYPQGEDQLHHLDFSMDLGMFVSILYFLSCIPRSMNHPSYLFIMIRAFI